MVSGTNSRVNHDAERRGVDPERRARAIDRRRPAPKVPLAIPGDIADLASLTIQQAQLLDHETTGVLIENATDDDVRAHPRALLHFARGCEPGQYLALRTSALDRLERLLDVASSGNGGGVEAASDIEALRYEIAAERAIDAARGVQLDDAEAAARVIIDAATTTTADHLAVARARATEALGRALAWRGTEHSSREAEIVLRSAADQYRHLQWTEPQAFVVFWLANAVFYQRGELDIAEREMREALGILSPESPRRAVVLTFYSDILSSQGRWPEVTTALEEAAQLAVRHNDALSRAYVAWSRARAASMRGDGPGTARALVETERHSADWFETNTGTTFLADAAEMLDRVGDHGAADRYLSRAQAREPDDEFVRQAHALLLARRGDPVEALAALRELNRAPWLEVRSVWRHTLFAAYATLRARRNGADTLAAQAFAQAAAIGGLDVASVAEHAIVTALTPAAAAAGSSEALTLLAPADGFVVRLFGDVQLSRGAQRLELPVGLPGALVRLLALHPAGLETDEVLDELWPNTDPKIGRRQLRDVRSRLRTKLGDVVARHGTRLRLTAAWVDAQAFGDLADRALASNGEQAQVLAVAAIALCTGELLPTDPYASWATTPRERYRRRRLGLLDMLATDAANRASLHEACVLLDEAITIDPYDEARYLQSSRHLLTLGRRVAARRMAENARARLDELGMAPSAEIIRILSGTDEIGS